MASDVLTLGGGLNRKLGDELLAMSSEQCGEWIRQRLAEIGDAHTMALHLAGWEIISPDSRYFWPFHSKDTGCPCPVWCFDVAMLKPKPFLRLVGKAPDHLA
jgi:hypothetical protein